MWALDWLVYTSKLFSQGSHLQSLGIREPGKVSVSRIKAPNASASRIQRKRKYSPHKPQYASSCQASASIMFAKIPLTKANHTIKARDNIGEK